MDRFEQLKQFIEMAPKVMLQQTLGCMEEEYLKRKKYNQQRQKLPIFRLQQRKYEKSEKGKKQLKMRNAHQAFLRQKSSKKCSIEEFKKIKLFYLLTPSGYHVDHVIPLNDGGLHMLENLQYLLASENHRKKKYTTTDMKVQLLRNRFIRKL